MIFYGIQDFFSAAASKSSDADHVTVRFLTTKNVKSVARQSCILAYICNQSVLKDASIGVRTEPFCFYDETNDTYTDQGNVKITTLFTFHVV